MHSCNDLFNANEAPSFGQLLRCRSSGVCPPAMANHVAMIRTPFGHIVFFDIGIPLHLSTIMSGLASHDLMTLLSRTCGMCRHSLRVLLSGR